MLASVAVALLAVTLGVIAWLERSRTGMIWFAVRDDPVERGYASHAPAPSRLHTPMLEGVRMPESTSSIRPATSPFGTSRSFYGSAPELRISSRVTEGRSSR